MQMLKEGDYIYGWKKFSGQTETSLTGSIFRNPGCKVGEITDDSLTIIDEFEHHISYRIDTIVFLKPGKVSNLGRFDKKVEVVCCYNNNGLMAFSHSRRSLVNFLHFEEGKRWGLLDELSTKHCEDDPSLHHRFVESEESRK